MASPKFSVVIPTRLRHATLPFTLRSCLQQKFDDYEVVVADNASLPATREVVEAFGSSRIKYIRSEQALPMTVSWSRALDAASGDWVLFVGDDDALLPWTLLELDRLVSQQAVRSVRWEIAVYTWPCVATADQRNRLQLPTARDVELVSSQQRVASMVRSPHAAPIPLPYHGLIHRSLYEKVKESGPVFDGPCPDTSAGVMLAALTDEFLELSVPMTLAGVSGKSNGLQGVVEDGTGETYQDFARLNEESQLRFHAELPQISLMPVIILDALLRMRDRLSAGSFELKLTAPKIAEHCLAGLWQEGEARANMLAEIESILPNADAKNRFRAAEKHSLAASTRPSAVLPLGQHSRHVVLDSSALGIRDVLMASETAAALLGQSGDPTDYSVSQKEVVRGICRFLRSHDLDCSGLGDSLPSRFARWKDRKFGKLMQRIKQRKAA